MTLHPPFHSAQGRTSPTRGEEAGAASTCIFTLRLWERSSQSAGWIKFLSSFNCKRPTLGNLNLPPELYLSRAGHSDRMAFSPVNKDLATFLNNPKGPLLSRMD